MGGKLSGYAIITGWELSGRGIIHDSRLLLKKLGKLIMSLSVKVTTNLKQHLNARLSCTSMFVLTLPRRTILGCNLLLYLY